MILQKGTLHSFQREIYRDLYCLKQMRTNAFSTLLDIGGNTGIVAIWARLLHPNMRVVSIEPHPETFAGLSSNVAGMHIEAYQFAYGDGAPAHLCEWHKWSTMNRFDGNGAYGDISVPSLTLRQMINKFKISTDRLMIKMDTEGAERYLLSNPDDIEILRSANFFVAETHTFPDFRVCDIVAKLGTLRKTHRLYQTKQRNHVFLALRKRGVVDVDPEQCVAMQRKDKRVRI